MNPLEQGTQRYTNKQLEDAPFNKTFTGIVTAKLIDGYSVTINNSVTYTNLPSLNSVVFSVNDTVAIIQPNNQPSQMFILGKLGY